MKRQNAENYVLWRNILNFLTELFQSIFIPGIEAYQSVKTAAFDSPGALKAYRRTTAREC